MEQKIEPTKEYYLAQVSVELREPLIAIAKAKRIEVRTLVSQVLRRFVAAREQLITDIANYNDGSEGTK